MLYLLSVVFALVACGQAKINSAEALPAEQPAWDAIYPQDVLEPYRAYSTRNVYQYAQGSIPCAGFDLPLKGYIVPTKAENHMVAVLYQIKTNEIRASEMAWKIRDGEGNTYSPVGFGGPNDMLIVTYGNLKEGSINNIDGGEKPLFALAFMLPREANQLILIDPRDQEGALQLSGEWKPGLENEIDGFKLSSQATMSYSCGEGWAVLPNLP